MKPEKNKAESMERSMHIDAYFNQVKKRSDKLMNYFLGAYFVIGIVFAFFYDTWLVAIGVGSLSLIAYYVSKYALPNSTIYQYVLSAVLGIFMAQFIYQMHGMFEMHFVAFIGSAMLITYQNWKLQLPLTLVVVIHHAVFGYLQYIGFDKTYFTQLEFMSLQTFIIHASLAAIIFYICGLWAYQFKKHSELYIEKTFETAKLQEAEAQKEALMKSNQELIKSNKELDQFVYSVSHDLRAPLSSILGIIGISKEETQEPQMIERLGFLEGSVSKLDTFIHDILDYSRNLRTEVEHEKIDFKEMIEGSMNNLKYMGSNNRHVDVKMRIKERRPFVSDRNRLNVILNNLLSNAIRYQNREVDNPFIEISVDTSEKETFIQVKDNGIGIAKEKQSKIFDMFYRVSDKSAGSGIGLYIVKETIEKLKGKIEVESTLGQGTSFKIYIPNSETLN